MEVKMSKTQSKVKGTKHAMDFWEEKFPELTKFVKDGMHEHALRKAIKKVIVRAGVKSGKRLLAMIFSAYTDAGPAGLVTNVFMSCYKRKADNNQRYDLSRYMHVCSVNTKKAAIECLNTLKDLSNKYQNVIVHYDEFDHGSGNEQLMGSSEGHANLWDYIMSNNKIKVIKYSASPEEGLVADPDEICLLMPDHPKYRGASYYLDNNLVIEAENPVVKDDDGYIIDISDQVKELLVKARKAFTDRKGQTPILVIRVADDFAGFAEAVKSNKIDELIYDVESEDIAVKCDFIASTDAATASVPWDDYQFWKNTAASAKRGKQLHVFFIDKQCMRSTDWFLHPFLFAYHDYHGESSALNTVIQSNLRVSYFIGKKDSDGISVYPVDTDFQILLYGDINVLEYVAGKRALETVSRKVSSRAVVSETDPSTFGRPFCLHLTDEQINLDCMQGSINDSKRPLVKKLILGLPGLTNENRQIIQNRTLLHRRRYTSGNDLGGIHTVHKRYVEGRVSKPGGGCECPSEHWDNRHKYFWMDFAVEDTNGIPKGTVYITYGIADEEGEEEQSFNHRISRDRRGVAQSVFANN
jgi:hypothetical protein